MKRERLLIYLLIVVAVIALPVSFADRAKLKLQKEIAAVEEAAAPNREQVAAVHRLREQLAAAGGQDELSGRLLGADPFAEMHQDLTVAAARAGVQLAEIALTGAVPSARAPGLQEYGANLEVLGTPAQFLQFVRLLEQHRLLIEIPDLQISIARPTPTGTGAASAPGGTAGASAERTRLSLHFFAAP